MMYLNESNISEISIRKFLFLLLIFGIGGLLFWQLKNFIPAFLGAYTLYILFRKWMFSLTKIFKGRNILAAILLMFLSFALILLPVYGLWRMLSFRVLPFLKYSNTFRAASEKFIHQFETQYGFTILNEQNFSYFENWIQTQLQVLIGATFNGFVTIVAMYFILFFMLTKAFVIENFFTHWLPLKKQNAVYLKKQLHNLVFSNAVGIPLVALFQSLVAWLGFWFAGVEEPFLWFIITCVSSMIPVLGSSLVSVPLSFMLIVQGHVNQGIFLLLYGFFIVGSVDNVFRFWLQKQIGDIHPLITVFGVIIGLDLFGFIGLIFGPILISFFLLLIEIYFKEFKEKS